MTLASRTRRATATGIVVLVAGACGSPASSSGPGSSGTPASPAPSASTSGTSGAPGTPAPSGSITVFAAASLSGTFPELGRQFQAAHPGTTVTFSFGASSTLAQQILAGAPADVFASASPRDMDAVTSAGDAGGPTAFAANTAEIAVAPASARRVTAIQDLAAPGVKVALCQPQVPCGALAQSVLSRAGVRVDPVTLGLDVKSTLAFVTSGQVDAAVVYATDVRAAGTAVTGVVVPAGDEATTTYPIATVKGSRNAALARAFEEYVLSADGRSVLTRAGFSAP